MSYCKRIVKAGSVIDVIEYHTARYGAPGQKREKRRKATPEEMAKANQRNKERQCWYLILANFMTGDYFLTLTYREQERPEDMEQAKNDFRKFITRVKKLYRREGYDLKWVRNIEVGTRGAWHVHMITNRIRGGLDIILKEWKHGRVQSQTMYAEGRFRDLAKYITKGQGNDQRLRESNYSTSRNLIRPVPEVRRYERYKTWRKMRIPKNYYVDPDSIVEGINPWTGYPYRKYVLVKDDYAMRC